MMMKAEEFQRLWLRFESEAQTSIHPISLNVITTCLSPLSSTSAGLSFQDYTFLREGICRGFYTLVARALLTHQPFT